MDLSKHLSFLSDTLFKLENPDIDTFLTDKIGQYFKYDNPNCLKSPFVFDGEGIFGYISVLGFEIVKKMRKKGNIPR